MKRLFFTTAILILTGIIPFLYAQNFIDIIAAGSAFSPENKLKNKNYKVNINESFVNIKLPLVLKNKDVIIIGTTVNVLKFNKQFGITDNNEFYAGAFQVGYTKMWNEKWNTLLMAIPKISSDFKDIPSNDFQLGGILLFTFTKKENLKYKFGAYYNQEFFGPLIVPILGIDWQPTEKLSIFGNLPISFTVDYKLYNRFSTGFIYQAPTNSYRLREYYNNAYLQKSSQDFFLYLDSYLSKNIVLTVKGGHSLGRSYRFYNENDKLTAKVSALNIGTKRQPLNNDLSDGFIFEIKLSYRISTVPK